MTKELYLRHYEEKDIPRAVDLLMIALPQLPNYRMIIPDRERMEYVLKSGIDNSASFAGWVLCDTHDTIHGFSGGWCVRSLMSLDYVADDIFMWIEPEYRNYANATRLIRAYTSWAKVMGAKLIRASYTGGSFPKGSREAAFFCALLERQGFKEIGSVFHLTTYGEK